MNPKLLVRKSVCNLLKSLPKEAHHYILSCINDVPQMALGTPFLISKSLLGGHIESTDTQARLFKNNPLVLKLMDSSKSNPVVMDIGANIGQTATAFSGFFPSARIYSFEPFTENFEHLKENVQDLASVSVHQLALSNREGELEVKRDRHPLSQWNSLDTSYQQTLEERGEFSIETLALTTGSAFCRETGISRVSLLKIDTEGHEMEVLQGFSPMFDLGAIDSVYVEVGFASDVAHGRFEEVDSFLRARGFNLFGFYEVDYLDDGTTNFANAFYLRRETLDSSPER